MASEITRIANATDFNGIYLLNGNLSGSIHNGSGMQSTGKLKVHFGTANDCAEDYYYIQIGTCTASALGFGTSRSGSVTPESIASAQNLNLTQDWLPAGSGAPAVIQSAVGYDPAFRIYEKNGAPPLSDRYYLVNDTATNRYRLFHTDPTATTLYGEVDVTNDAPSSTGVSSISTQALAQQALITVKNAIISKDKIRANLGALQNRLENTISNLQIQAENLQAAESRISDLDVATEMTEFVRRQILTQAAVAMLSQANSLPRMALQLMG